MHLLRRAQLAHKSHTMSKSTTTPHEMLPVPTALHIVLTNIARHISKSNGESTVIPIEQCYASNINISYISAKCVTSPMPFPPFDASIMDGFCIRLKDDEVVVETGIGQSFEVTGCSLAQAATKEEGSTSSLSSCIQNEARYVATGAAIPLGFNTVIPIEQIQITIRDNITGNNLDISNIELLAAIESNDHTVMIQIIGSDSDMSSTRIVKRNQWIRRAGCDLPINSVLMDAGQVIGPVQIGLLVQSGIQEINVRPVPKVGVLSTGNELLSISSPPASTGLKYGQIYDVNRPSLLALMRQFGAEAVDLGCAMDRRESLVAKIRQGLRDCDILITSGGVSMGELDLLEDILVTTFGATVHFGRIHMKPGKPTTFLTCSMDDNDHGCNKITKKTRFIFALPGNPVSVMVCSHLFLRPAVELLRRGSNSSAAEDIVQHALVHPEIDATLESNVKVDVERPEYHRVSIRWDASTGRFIAKSTGVQRSSRLMSMDGAHGLMCLPQGVPGEKMLCKVGESWPVLLIDGPYCCAEKLCRWKDSRHANGRIFEDPTASSTTKNSKKAPKMPLKVGIVSIDGCSASMADLKLRVLSSLDTAVIVYSKSSSDQDVVKMLKRNNDTEAELIVVVANGGFKRDSRVAAALSDVLDKRADALALQIRQWAATQNGLAGLFEVVVGRVNDKVIVFLPEVGLEGGLKKVYGRLIFHAIMIGKGK